jgi:hypothetical protein
MRVVQFLGWCGMAMAYDGSTHVHMLEWGRPDGQGSDGSAIAGIRIEFEKSHLKWFVMYCRLGRARENDDDLL